MKKTMTAALVAMMWVGMVWADKPNVVIIYGDDVGIGDVGFGGSKMIPTPNIDRPARGGLVFTDGHCSSSACSPSRFAILTGQHPLRNGLSVIAPGGPLAIIPDTFTLPDLFKKAGYDTAVIGKWHLGIGPGDGSTGTADWNGEVKPGPLEIGFDYSFVIPSTNDRVPCVFLRNHRVVNLDPNDPIYIDLPPYVVPPLMLDQPRAVAWDPRAAPIWRSLEPRGGSPPAPAACSLASCAASQCCSASASALLAPVPPAMYRRSPDPAARAESGRKAAITHSCTTSVGVRHEAQLSSHNE
jgi:hypothetical protein